MEIRAVEDEQIDGHYREGFRERNQWGLLGGKLGVSDHSPGFQKRLKTGQRG
jgi:hypothetical protein